MTLLIDINLPEWMSDEELRAILRPLLPDVTLRCASDAGDRDDVVMLATARIAPGRIKTLPCLSG